MRGTAARAPRASSKGAGQIGGAIWLGEGEGLLGGEAEGLRGFAPGDVAAGGLGGEPLADVAFVGVGNGGELGGGHGVSGEGLVEAELIAENDHAGVHGGAEVTDEAADEGVQGVHVEGGCCD